MTSITVSSEGPFMRELWILYNVPHIPNSSLDRNRLPKRFIVFKISEKDFFPGLLRFLGTVFDLPGFVCLGCNLSYTDRILRANITLACDCEAGVLLFDVILYIWRNCWRAFSVGVALTFFKTLFKVSTIRSACPLDRGSNVIDLVWFVEVFKLSRCKLASIVRHNDVYYTKPCEQLMQNFYGDFCGWVFTSIGLYTPII